uniref:Uncharacterized protein n=1 Tax=Sphaerodactylus townsendi TaxID=933632 RepID=A0ACB8F3F3_9SAUR
MRPNLVPGFSFVHLSVITKVVYSSDRNVKEAEQVILQKKISQTRLIQEDESLKFTNLHDDPDHGRISGPQNFPSGAVETAAVASFIANEISEETVDAEGNVTVSDNYKGETASDLGKELLMLYEKSWFSDITIWIDGKPFQGHRAILCARSSYFSAMLNGRWAESIQEHITLQG